MRPKIGLYNLTTTTKIGGVETWVVELARHLAEGGYPYDIAIIGGVAPKGFALPEAGVGVRVITRPFVSREILRRVPLLNRQYGLTKLLERLTFGVTALPHLWREKYDILHIQKPYDLPVAWLAIHLPNLWRPKKGKILFGSHGRDFFPSDRLWARLAIDDAIACSAYNADDVGARYHIRPEVTYNGVDTALFSPRACRPEIRAMLANAQPGTPAYDQPLLVFPGRLVRWKGAEYAIEAVAHLKERGVAVRLAVLGTGDYKPTLVALAERLGVADALNFLDPLPMRDMPDVFAASDIVVAASFANETFGITLTEAMACERSVVASDFGGFREVVVDGVTGLRYPPQDSRALADALERLIADPALRRRMGEAGRAWVIEKFEWSRVAAHVAHVYNRMVGARKPVAVS